MTRGDKESPQNARHDSPLDEETHDLDLAGSVECNQAHVCLWEGLGACDDLLQHLHAVAAAEHGELPHGPVAVVVVGLCGTMGENVGTKFSMGTSALMLRESLI